MTIDGNEYLIAPAGAGTLRDLRADELESVAGGCCCGMPGCESKGLCGPEIHTDMVPMLIGPSLYDLSHLVPVRTVCR